MVNQAALQNCAEEAWRQYDSFEGKDVVVDPSIPILYFGDLEAYAESERKIVTVGLNPSDNEFPDEDERFDIVRPGEGYFNTLNEYFGRNPLDSWFGHYEKVLQGLNASYYDDADNAALHTDLCSPLATKETWASNGFSDELKDDLIAIGRPLWKNLIDQLAPDLIVASVAYDHIADLAEGERSVVDIDDCQAACVITRLVSGSARTPPYMVLRLPYYLSSGETASIVYARARNVPLGEIGNDQKEEIGEQLATLV